MRRYLQPPMRRIFDLAWRAVPLSSQKALRATLRYVRCVDDSEAKGVECRCRDGSVFQSDEWFVGWCAYDLSAHPPEAHLYLNRVLTEDIPHGIATALHELAHALELHDDGIQAVHGDDASSELHAWLQAAAWAARLSYTGKVYAEARDRALDCALAELRQQTEKEFVDAIASLKALLAPTEESVSEPR